MYIKVLAIGDLANSISTLSKYVKKSKIHLINFPLKGASTFTYDNNVEFFDSLLISKQVKKIKEIKQNFDICITMTWAGARLAYLADLNYIIYFVGSDIRIPPFLKNLEIDFLKETPIKLNLIERKFYKNVFENSIACVTGGEELFDKLTRYRKDAIRIDRVPIDTKIFNENIEPINIKKNKFTFFCPQRNSLEKGIDILWESLPMCKSHFEVLMVNWFDERTTEEKNIRKKMLENKPRQVKFIPIVKREHMARYYALADAVIGELKKGVVEYVDREAAMCKKPVISYTNPKLVHLIDGKKIIPPYLPHSKNPKEIAELIDKVVESKEFREKLRDDEYEFIKEASDPEKAAEEWDKLFVRLFNKHKSINKDSNFLKIKFLNFLMNLSERLIYSRTMKEKNIQAWGKTEYKRLTKK